MKISIIIVHWNTPKELAKQLDILKSFNDLEVIVVDNASDVHVHHSRLIQNKSNIGFAKACNRGAKIAKGEWLLFLNPDTHITSENALAFVRKAEERNLDAASLQSSSDNYSKPLPTPFSLLVEFSPLRRLVPLSVFKQKTLFGGGLLIKKRVLEKLNGWDEEFFLWFEDSDLTRRLLSKDYKIGWIDVPYTHEGGASFKKLSDQKKKDIFFTSMNLYSNKHFGFFGKSVVRFVTFLNR